LDKLHLLHNKPRLQPVRRRRRILPPQHSSRLRRDSKHLPRICRRGSNRRRRQENPGHQDNLQPRVNLECRALRPVRQELA
jgi:hypothetical protein